MKTTLFEREPSGITYRIPALLYLRHCHTFLAFAEKRTSSCDHDAKILVMRRGLLKDDGSVQVSYSRSTSTDVEALIESYDLLFTQHTDSTLNLLYSFSNPTWSKFSINTQIIHLLIFTYEVAT